MFELLPIVTVFLSSVFFLLYLREFEHICLVFYSLFSSVMRCTLQRAEAFILSTLKSRCHLFIKRMNNITDQFFQCYFSVLLSSMEQPVSLGRISFQVSPVMTFLNKTVICILMLLQRFFITMLDQQNDTNPFATIYFTSRYTRKNNINTHRTKGQISQSALIE